MILSDEAIEIAIDEIAKALAMRGLSDEQVIERLTSEVHRVSKDLKIKVIPLLYKRHEN